MSSFNTSDVLARFGQNVYPGIAATGREGVWRLLQFEYRTPLEDVSRGMENDTLYIQPESEGFILVELQSGIIINLMSPAWLT